MTSFDEPESRQRGFSYVWTLMTIAMLGVGLSIAAEVYALGMKRERERELLFVGHEFRAALRSYYRAQMRAGQHEYPASLDDLLKDGRFPGNARHLRRIYIDPLTGNADWGLVRMGGRIVGIHSRSEGRPVKQDNFDMDDSAFRNRQKYSEWVFTYPPSLIVDAQMSLGAQADRDNQGGE